MLGRILIHFNIEWHCVIRGLLFTLLVSRWWNTNIFIWNATYSPKHRRFSYDKWTKRRLTAIKFGVAVLFLCVFFLEIINDVYVSSASKALKKLARLEVIMNCSHFGEWTFIRLKREWAIDVFNAPKMGKKNCIFWVIKWWNHRHKMQHEVYQSM